MLLTSSPYTDFSFSFGLVADCRAISINPKDLGSSFAIRDLFVDVSGIALDRSGRAAPYQALMPMEG